MKEGGKHFLGGIRKSLKEFQGQIICNKILKYKFHCCFCQSSSPKAHQKHCLDSLLVAGRENMHLGGATGCFSKRVLEGTSRI